MPKKILEKNRLDKTKKDMPKGGNKKRYTKKPGQEHRTKNSKTVYELEKDDLDFRIYSEYINQGGIQGELPIGDIVSKFRPHSTPEANKMYGWRLLNNPKIKKRFADKFAHRRKASVLTIEERRQYLSDIIMQEIEENSTLGERLKCLFELNKMDGVGTSNANLIVNNNQISLEDERKMTEKKLNEILGIEVKEAEIISEKEVDEDE